MFMRGDYGKDRDPPFLMLGCGRGFLQRDDPTASLQAARNRKEEAIFITRVMEIEHGTFTQLVFTTTGGMADECRRYHCPLAELISTKKGEPYAATISWIRTKVSFAIRCYVYEGLEHREDANLQI